MTSPQQDRIARCATALAFLEKKTKRLTQTGTALAWGLLGSTVGYVFGSMWMHLDSHAFLTVRELSTLGYVAFVACYGLFARSYFATHRCLSNAKLLFISERVTEKEYNRMRDKCLKKGELI